MMREVSESEVVSLAGESDCPVLGKEESEAMEAAVCLKQFPQGSVLGISDKLEDLKLFFLRVERRPTSGITTTVRACMYMELPLADFEDSIGANLCRSLDDSIRHETSTPKNRAGVWKI
jgi:hypothetical protein